MKKISIFAGITVFSILLIVVLFNLFMPSNSNEMLEMDDYYVVENGDITQTLNLVGNIDVSKKANVMSQTSARITKDYFEEGDIVKKGDVLYELDTKDVNSKIKSAEANVQKSKLNYDNSVQESNSYGIRSNTTGVLASLSINQGQYIINGIEIGEILNHSKPIITIELLDYVELDAIKNNIETIFSNEKKLLGEVHNSTTKMVEDTEVVSTMQLTFQEQVHCVVNDKVTILLNGKSCSAVIKSFSYEKQPLIANAEGKVTKINFVVGNEIKSGDLIANVENADNQLKVSQNQLDLQDAQDNLSIIKKELNTCKILSPIDGVILKKYYSAGDVYDSSSAETPMMNIADFSSYIIKTYANEKDVLQLKIGQSATISSDTIPNLELTGTVKYIGNIPEENGELSGYEVVVEIDSNTESKNLKIGMGVNLTITTETKQNVLIIPSYCIQEGDIVLKLNSEANGSCDEVKVITGINNDEYTEIISGLKVNDKILLMESEE